MGLGVSATTCTQKAQALNFSLHCKGTRAQKGLTAFHDAGHSCFCRSHSIYYSVRYYKFLTRSLYILVIISVDKKSLILILFQF
jgi:hypothetical protein